MKSYKISSIYVFTFFQVPTYEQLAQLQFLEVVIKEVMRLYPDARFYSKHKLISFQKQIVVALLVAFSNVSARRRLAFKCQMAMN